MEIMMAWNLSCASFPFVQSSPKFIFFPKHKISSLSSSSFTRAAASSSSSNESSSSSSNESSSSSSNESSSSSSSNESLARNRLDLLEQLTSSSNGNETDGKLTIREQLALLAIDRDDDFVIPLGKNLKKFSAEFLTTSQKRNIKRQTYLTEVSKRNDSAFFATVGAFIILPPFAILGIAIATGYLHLL